MNEPKQSQSLPHQSTIIKRLPDEEIIQQYMELLYAVERKFVGETRHETALRYIMEAEKQDNNQQPCQEA